MREITQADVDAVRGRCRLKPGWRTSELTIVGLSGATIYELASAPCAALPEAIVRAAACLALAWVSARYASARTEAKGRAGGAP